MTIQPINSRRILAVPLNRAVADVVRKQLPALYAATAHPDLAFNPATLAAIDKVPMDVTRQCDAIRKLEAAAKAMFAAFAECDAETRKALQAAYAANTLAAKATGKPSRVLPSAKQFTQPTAAALAEVVHSFSAIALGGQLGVDALNADDKINVPSIFVAAKKANEKRRKLNAQELKHETIKRVAVVDNTRRWWFNDAVMRQDPAALALISTDNPWRTYGGVFPAKLLKLVDDLKSAAGFEWDVTSARHAWRNAYIARG